MFQPELTHCHTESEPFSFDQRDKELKKKKEEAVMAIILEEERKVSSFSIEDVTTIFTTNHVTWICTIKAPSTRIRIFFNPQLFLSGYENIRVHTLCDHSVFKSNSPVHIKTLAH